MESCYKEADIIVKKYNLDGNEIWQKRIKKKPYNYASDMYIDEENTIYICGKTCNEQDMDAYECDMITAKLDENGEILWQTTFSSEEEYDDEAEEIIADEEGNVYVAGKAFFHKSPSEDDYCGCGG